MTSSKEMLDRIKLMVMKAMMPLSEAQRMIVYAEVKEMI
jgi:hypothetical protein